MKYECIDSEKKLLHYVRTLKDESITCIALDIECEFELHCYGQHLCLIQIFDGKRIILIDPFSIDKKKIGELFNNRNIMKIMYDSKSDQSLIYKNYNTQIKSILDLKPAVTTLGFEKQGFSNVLESVLGIKSGKNMQTYNWMKRPIADRAVEYAINDVIYLFDLKEKLFEKLIQQNKLDDYILMNLKIQNDTLKKDNLPNFFKKNAFKMLNKQEQEIAKKIYYIRDKYASRFNLSPNSLLNNAAILEISKGTLDFNSKTLFRKLPNTSIKSIQQEIAACLKT